MNDDLRDLILGDEEDELDDLPEPLGDPLLDDEEDTRRPDARARLSPAAFFVFSMFLFFGVCLLSLMVLLITGRILPG
ncbi:MAG: hypothetical protein GXO37_05395 [Chloroflexi bacterium]|nr:hypothetical protein [Chloroflexota bacterium]